MLDARARAVQSTPIFGQSGVLVGMLSMHYHKPTRLDDSQLKLIDNLAAQAGALMGEN
jgi:GAF domain-containing protein